jgi:hypothetical protein
MRQTFVLLGTLALLIAQPLAAAPLAPGKPAGVRPAQADNLLPVYGGVLLFGALLAVTIGVNGSSVAPSTSTANGVSCCG